MTIASWCVLIALILPYAWFGVLNAKAGAARDNSSPRDFLLRLEGPAKRALGAHLNSFEANTAFVAGVLIAQMAHAPQGRIDAAALLFVVLRVAYGLLYLAGQSSARSLVWSAGFACTVALFVIAALA
jgi:uncharacterized MAPEG superfamily protein